MQRRGGNHRGAFPENDRGDGSSHLSDYTAADRQRDRKMQRKQQRAASKRARVEKHEAAVVYRRQAREAAAHYRLEESQRRERAVVEQQQRKLKKKQRASVSIATKKDADGPSQKRRRSASVGEKVPSCSDTLATVAREKRMKKDRLLSARGASSTTPTPKSPPASHHTMVEVPIIIAEKARRLVNKLTMSNVSDLTKDLSADLLGGSGIPRSTAVAGLAQQIQRLCALEAGPLSTTGTLPFAGLLRGIQLLHGAQVGADLIEHLSFYFQAQLDAGNEGAASNTLMVLAQLYLLYGVDVVYVLSLLRMLLRQGAHVGHGSGAAAGGQAMCAAACGLALMRACGEKLLKEGPSELEAALQDARRVSARIGSITGTARFSALVDLMGEIAAGHGRKGRRTATEQDAPVEMMLDKLCLLLPGMDSGNSSSGNTRVASSQKRTMRRLVLTTSVLSGISWEQMMEVEKPPRWYGGGALWSSRADKGGVTVPQDDRDALEDTASSASRDSFDEEERKRERVSRIRAEEKAISGQRLNTEHKRDIFKCLSAATDDLECFNMLMHRDPGYTRFHDVCAVLLQCCYQGKNYNPYYGQVLLRFCSAKPACVKTLQFAIWDRFKSIRIDAVDIAGYFNLSCLLTDLIDQGIYTLSLLRGLDLEDTNKTVGLFARILLLRLMLQLQPHRLTQLFFGGDGSSAHDLNVDTTSLRRLLTKFVSLYFIDEAASKRWLPMLYDVVASGTAFDVHRRGGGGQDDRAPDDAVQDILVRNASRPTSSLASEADAPSRRRISSTPMTPDDQMEVFLKRVKVVFKALRGGIS